MINQQAVRFTILICLLSLSCSRRETDVLQLANSPPQGILQRDAPIILMFSRAVVSSDSANQWTATPYIEFSPEIPGKFTWRDTSTLVFSADGPLPGDTKFTAKLNTGLLTRLSGMKTFKGEHEFTFSTQSFTLIKGEFFYDRMGKTRTVGIKANLEFTYAVNPLDVIKHVKVTINNEVRQAQSVSAQYSNIIPIELGATQQLKTEKHITIAFDDGLISTETNTHIRMDEPFVFRLPGLDEVKIYGHEFGTDGSTGWITFSTSQEIDLQTAKSYISLDPAVDYALEGSHQTLTMRGKFNPGSTFHLKVRKGLESVLGAKSQNDYEADVVVGNIKPSFRFSSAAGSYMLLAGQKALEIKTINIKKLSVRVSQIFQNNLVYFIDEGRYYDYNRGDDDEDGYSHSYNRKYRYVLKNYGRKLGEDTLNVQKAVNREVTSRFALSRYLDNGYKGFYMIEIADAADPWRTTSKLVSISDIGLIVKQSPDEIMVFVTSLETNQPIPGAAINLVSTNNQVIASMRSDDEGVAHFANFRRLKKDFDLKLITGEVGSDFNFINLDDYRVETSRFRVDGKRDARNVYDAYLYGDRTMYRPGETMYFSGVLRNLSGPLPAQVPVKLRIVNPRGAVVRETQHTLNEEGSFETSYKTQTAAITGSYTADLFTGNNVWLTGYTVSLEDFVPDRLKVKLAVSADTALPGEKLTYKVQALNFFGPPAAGRNYEFEGTFDIIPYFSKSFPAFRFGDENAKNFASNPEVYTGKTDDSGRARIEFAIPENATSQGLLLARGRTGVFDESGRPVYQVAQTIITPKEYFIGMRNMGAYYISPRTPQTVQIVAVDRHDRSIAGFRAAVNLIRLEWHSVLRQAGEFGSLRYVSEQREILVRSDTVTLDQTPYEYSYTVDRCGEYIVRV
ncbi:MAG TPA: MG2 domain-containing protein, partial [Bacteroidota bacterium]|nr:MG2 domain-containing protein [Bacteroidota bacterium]